MRQFLAQLKNWRNDMNAKMLRLKGGLGWLHSAVGAQTITGTASATMC